MSVTVKIRSTKWGLMSAVCALALVASVGAQAQTPPANSDQIQEITVTAQKRTESTKDIPVSISAVTGTDLNERHISDFDDLTRTTPGISFGQGGSGNGAGSGLNNIEIRGVSSSSGSATVGIYLDETSITVPNKYDGATQPYPFDIERVEILRGPQGTLYGASSMGGTVRFITNKANLNDFQVNVTSDLSGTEHGGVNYNESVVVNYPVIPGVFAVRVGVDYGSDSGWIDNYNAAPAPGNASVFGATDPYIGQTPTTLNNTGVNDERHGVVKLSALIKPGDDWTITPSMWLQRVQSSDSPIFYPKLGLYKQEKEVAEFSNDRVFVPSLTVDKDFGFANFTSVSSYFARNFSRQTDGTYYNDTIFSQLLQFIPSTPQQLAQDTSIVAHIASPVSFPTKYGQISQEFRLASPPPGEGELPLRWTAGVYYNDQWNYHQNNEFSPGLNAAFEQIYGVPMSSPAGIALLQNTLPIGADPSSITPDTFANDLIFTETMREDTRQLAAFGQLEYDVLSDLHAAAGLRYQYARTSYTRTGGGYYDIGNNHDDVQLGHYYRPTPKVSLTYDIDQSTTVYTSAAEGFRLGGPTGPDPTGPGNVCQEDYNTFGIPGSSDKFGSDNLWSYEGGVKAVLADRTLSINSAVYYIVWKDIQQRINLPVCGFSFITNVGNAESWGGETEIKWKPRFVPGLTLNLTGNAGKSTITKSLVPGVAAVGEHVLYTPDFTVTIGGEYAWAITDAISGFVRTDYDFNGKSSGSYVRSGSASACGLDPGACFSPNYSDPMYGVLNASAGIDTGEMQVFLFAKNLANDQTIIQRPQVNSVIEGYTVQPLTVGLSFAHQF
jgi:outer membrane receptor protein involved in Fe transport